MNFTTSTPRSSFYALLIALALCWLLPTLSFAATLSLTPNTGVYTVGGVFTARVVVNSQGQNINAAEGTLRFNPRELAVVSVDRSNSIFSLWVTEPTFSNTAGTISFSGGSPTGYQGAAGTIMNVTFRVLAAGTARVNLADGSVLANDGRGSNVLSGMSGGTFTIQAPASTPEAERVIEYVSPVNTPAAPVVTSSTHPIDGWSADRTAVLRWTVPSGVTGVRTLLNESATAVPTRVYDTPISEITLNDLPDGISYFHIQFRNADGWGRVTHYRLAVDARPPQDLQVRLADEFDAAQPVQRLRVTASSTAPLETVLVKINDREPIELSLSAEGEVTLPALPPGYHLLMVEVRNAAGLSAFATLSMTLTAFERPIFTQFPRQITEDMIPLFQGQTRPGSLVSVIVRRDGVEPRVFQVEADDEGNFTFIPDGTFLSGVYEISAQATAPDGAQSEVSQVVRMIVQQPGLLRVGRFLVSVLSVVVPLIVLTIALVLSLWYFVVYLRRFRRKVTVESREALEMLRQEFTRLEKTLDEQESALGQARKTGSLTKAEIHTIVTLRAALLASKQRVEKEIIDVTNLTNTPTT